MCSALECADWRIADISIDVDDAGRPGEELCPTLQYKISFEQPQPQQEAQSKGQRRKGSAQPRCTLLVEESMQGAEAEDLEPADTLGTPENVSCIPWSASGTPKDVHARLREAIRRASSAPNGSSEDGPHQHFHQALQAHRRHTNTNSPLGVSSSESLRLCRASTLSGDHALSGPSSGRGLVGSTSCSGSGRGACDTESCSCSTCDSTVSLGVGSFVDPGPQKGKTSLPAGAPSAHAHNPRLDSALLVDALHGLFGCHSPSSKAGAGKEGQFKDSPGALGKPPKWAKGKEPLAERLVARCRSAAGSGEFSLTLSDRDALESARSPHNESPRRGLVTLKSEGGSGSSASGSRGQAQEADEEDEGAPRLVLSSRRTSSTPTNLSVEGREDEVRSRKGRRGAQDKSQWEGLYGA